MAFSILLGPHSLQNTADASAGNSKDIDLLGLSLFEVIPHRFICWGFDGLLRQLVEVTESRQAM